MTTKTKKKVTKRTKKKTTTKTTKRRITKKTTTPTTTGLPNDGFAAGAESTTVHSAGIHTDEYGV